ncbi:SPOSA6832_03829, partial [Sporobolomyces salmonicolor]
MGQTLSEPVVDKHTQQGADDRQGWRLTMEDAHAGILSLGDESAAGKKTSFFAVYDGHGGSTVAKFAGDTVHSRLAANEFFKKRDFEAGLKRAFLETDEDLRSNPDFRGDPSGCTAVAVIVTEDRNIICANAGDSRAVMSVGGEAKPLSYDHKPTNQGETSRIVAAGGFVEFGRVNGASRLHSPSFRTRELIREREWTGNLALSRALGDFEFKQNSNLDPEQQIVTADPDITVHQATADDEFIVIACDGIWDVLTSQQVIDYVRLSIAQSQPLSTICESLMDRCLAPDSDWGGVGCDNMTLMVVALLGDRTQDEWYEWVKARVDAPGDGYATPKEFVEPFAQGGNGPRGALMAGGGSGGAGGGGIVVGRAGPGGAVPGALSLSYGGGGGHGEGDEDSDEGEEQEFDLPSIQAALRARMAELEREEAARAEASDEEAGATPAVSKEEDAEMSEPNDDEESTASKDAQEAKMTTSLTPPKIL